MKTILLALLASIAIGGSAIAQDTTKSKVSGAESTANAAASVEELEAKFKATLTNATFSGRWSSVKDGQLGPEKEDKYTILGATKINGDNWVINARIQYGQRDIVAPIPVQVKWAGDTPVIIVDNLSMPGGNNKYSARVLVHDNAYAGRWSAGERGGLVNGIILRTQDSSTNKVVPPSTAP